MRVNGIGMACRVAESNTSYMPRSRSSRGLGRVTAALCLLSGKSLVPKGEVVLVPTVCRRDLG
jgi:hypothetical protein